MAPKQRARARRVSIGPPDENELNQPSVLYLVGLSTGLSMPEMIARSNLANDNETNANEEAESAQMVQEEENQEPPVNEPKDARHDEERAITPSDSKKRRLQESMANPPVRPPSKPSRANDANTGRIGTQEAEDDEDQEMADAENQPNMNDNDVSGKGEQSTGIGRINCKAKPEVKPRSKSLSDLRRGRDPLHQRTSQDPLYSRAMHVKFRPR